MKAVDTGAYTPPLGYEILTPLYDSAIRYLTREKIWRTALVEQINPQADDRILDVGCGTGSLLAALSQRCPNAEYVGLDPDAHALNRASEKLENRNVSFVHGFLAEAALPNGWRPTKIVSSLMFHQVPLVQKRQIVETMRTLLGLTGEVHIADYAIQTSHLMRAAFRMTVQLLDGVEDTQHNADGILEEILMLPGYQTEKTATFWTATGAIALFKVKSV